MGNGKQTEMGGEINKRDAVGKAAVAYLDAQAKVALAKEALEAAGGELIDEMKKGKRTEVKLDGKTISLLHVESQDWIRVRKAKQTSKK